MCSAGISAADVIRTSASNKLWSPHGCDDPQRSHIKSANVRSALGFLLPLRNSWFGLRIQHMTVAPVPPTRAASLAISVALIV